MPPYPKPKIKEKEIENSILDFLKLTKVFAWKNETTGIYDEKRKVFRKKHGHSLKGVSDILGVFDSRFLAIEVKAQGKYLTKEQKDFLEKVNESGGIGFVARSVEDVIRALGVS